MFTVWRIPGLEYFFQHFKDIVPPSLYPQYFLWEICCNLYIGSELISLAILKTFFFIEFGQIDYDISWYNFLHMSYISGLLNFLKLWVSRLSVLGFLWVKASSFLAIIFFQVFLCWLLPDRLSFRTLITQLLGYLKLIHTVHRHSVLGFILFS